VRLEGLGKMRKSNNLIGIRTRKLPACSIVPQPTMLPRASHLDDLEGNNRKRAQHQKMRDALDALSRQVESLHELEMEQSHVINLRIR
jgi:hypothetical protein